MKSEAEQHNMHMEALIWKTLLQEIEELLASIMTTLDQAKLHLDTKDIDNTTTTFSKNATHYLDKTHRIKQRVSKFENELSLLSECDTSQCDAAFFDEAETISRQTNDCKKNVEVLASEISLYTNSKISD